MSQQVITTVTAPDNSQIFAERVAQRMPSKEAVYDSRVSMWGTYIDIELAKDSIKNYTSIHDNHRVCSVGSRDLSFSEIYTTSREAARLYDIANARKIVSVVTAIENTANIWLSNIPEPEVISKEGIIEYLRAWDDGWK